MYIENKEEHLKHEQKAQIGKLKNMKRNAEKHKKRNTEKHEHRT